MDRLYLPNHRVLGDYECFERDEVHTDLLQCKVDVDRSLGTGHPGGSSSAAPYGLPAHSNGRGRAWGLGADVPFPHT